MNTVKHTLYASLLGLALTAGVSPAQAADHDLWREQVPTSSDPVIRFTPRDGRKSEASDYLLWREQVATADGIVYEQDGTQSGYSRVSARPEYLLWREQI